MYNIIIDARDSMDGFDSVLNISHTVAIKKVVQRRYMLMYKQT